MTLLLKLAAAAATVVVVMRIVRYRRAEQLCDEIVRGVADREPEDCCCGCELSWDDLP